MAKRLYGPLDYYYGVHYELAEEVLKKLDTGFIEHVMIEYCIGEIKKTNQGEFSELRHVINDLCDR